MSFLFVDRIFEYEAGKSIRGIKNVTRNESFFYWLPDGKRVLSPAVVTEAVAQLGAWLNIVTSDFQKRVVLLADEMTTYEGIVSAGDQIDLFVDIIDLDDDVVVTKSRAEVRGEVVLDVQCCRGYLLPLSDFSDPNLVRLQFNNLYRPELSYQRALPEGYKPLSPFAGLKVMEGLRFVDGIVEHQPGKRIVGFKNFSSCEPYFSEHFPRKPIVPGVLIMTFMGEVCQYLVKNDIYQPQREKALVPTFIKDVRFRKFVEPGDQCILTAEVIEGSFEKDGDDVVIRASIMANDKRVMQAKMGFRLMSGCDSQVVDHVINPQSATTNTMTL